MERTFNFHGKRVIFLGFNDGARFKVDGTVYVFIAGDMTRIVGLAEILALKLIGDPDFADILFENTVSKEIF